MTPGESRFRHPSGLVLIGYRGTGKSTVGRIVAERRRCPFADADIELERAAGRSIRSIFEVEGEPAFRRLETSTLADLVAAPNLAGGVLSTGGGAILAEANRRVLRTFGLTVWLTADPDTLAHRLTHSRNPLADRPPLTAAGTLSEVATVLGARTPLYREAADLEMPSNGRSVHEVADAVLHAWESWLTVRPGWERNAE